MPALKQTNGLIGSIIAILGLELAVPDHTTLSGRIDTLEAARSPPGSGPVHLLVDSTGLKLCGAGTRLLEKHRTRLGRSGTECTAMLPRTIQRRKIFSTPTGLEHVEASKDWRSDIPEKNLAELRLLERRKPSQTIHHETVYAVLSLP